MTQFQFRLIDTGSPAGELLADRLIDLVQNLQGISTRIGRAATGGHTRGKLRKTTEEMVALSIGLAYGSTTLQWQRASRDSALELELPHEVEFDRTFETVITAPFPTSARLGSTMRSPMTSVLSELRLKEPPEQSSSPPTEQFTPRFARPTRRRRPGNPQHLRRTLKWSASSASSERSIPILTASTRRMMPATRSTRRTWSRTSKQERCSGRMSR